MKVLLLIITLLGLIATQTYPNCPGSANQQPVLTGTPNLLQKVANGQKYLLKNGTSFVYLLKVQGRPYDMGLAYGQLMKEELKQALADMSNWFKGKINQTLANDYKIPKFLLDMLSSEALYTFLGLLELNWLVAKPYVPPYIIEEMYGIADGAQVRFEDILQANMLPELTRAGCTIVGAWKNSTVNQQMYQLRALDWNPDAPVNKFPLITIYFPNEGNGNIFANIGYTGMIGTLTAFSKSQIAISQKVWIPNPKNDSIHWSYIGEPWTFVLRDVAQFTNTLQEAVDLFYNAKRTIMNMFGIGSGQSKQFEGIEYASNLLYTFNDQNYTYNSPTHPKLDGVFYWDKHTQPSNDPCLGNILSANLGNITAATLYRDVTGASKTGNAQICVFDVYNNIIYLSYSEANTNQDAFLRSVMQINLTQFWTF